jgi:hypothetical protein
MEKTKTGFLGKLSWFFGNKWTKFGFSFVSLGYLYFLGWVAWITFGFYFVLDNAVALFFVYSFINVLFAITMIYTRKKIITQTVTLFMHPMILVMLIYGFGNWFLILPVFVTATVIFFASGANESLKIILGTIYMILFVLAFLAYITFQTMSIPIPHKMNLELREYPSVEIAYTPRPTTENPAPFRLVAYVDPETKENRTANYFVERTDLDISLWNLRLERTFGSTSTGAAIRYGIDFELKWLAPNELLIDGRLLKIDEEGNFIVGDTYAPDDEEITQRPEVTRRIEATAAEPEE